MKAKCKLLSMAFFTLYFLVETTNATINLTVIGLYEKPARLERGRVGHLNSFFSIDFLLLLFNYIVVL